MKIPVLFTLLFAMSAICLGQEGITFKSFSWQDALEASKKEGKPLFVACYVTWSEPCAVLEDYSFVDPEVGDFFNEQFINLRLDMEDFPGIELADQYEVNSYPTLLFINAKGEILHRGCGAIDAPSLLELAKNAMGDQNLMEMSRRFETGDRALDFLIDYSILLEQACMDKNDLVNAYFREVPQKDWLSETSWNMINLNVTNPYSKPFQYLMAYHDRYAMQFGKDTVDQKIYDVLIDQLIAIYEGEDLTLFATLALKKLLSEVDFKNKSELLSLADLKAADLQENWSEFAANAVKVVKEQQVTDATQLNEFAWKFYLFVDDELQLNTATEWMKGVLKRQPEPTYYDTYASLLFKLGKQKEAIKYGQRALKAAELVGEDLMHYKAQLKLFESGN